MSDDDPGEAFDDMMVAIDARQLRCESCDHLAEFHHGDGCWYTVTIGTLDKDLVCVCTVPLGR